MQYPHAEPERAENVWGKDFVRLLCTFDYFGGYTNGCSGYFPTAEEFEKGGYEVYWCMLVYYIYYERVFPLQRESAQRLVDAEVQGLERRK